MPKSKPKKCHNEYFHIPYVWQKNPDMVYLANRKYLKDSKNGISDVIIEAHVPRIKKILEGMNYMNERKVIHEYLHHMIEDIIYRNNEVYVTKNTIKNNPSIQSLVGGMLPNFIIKSRGPRRTSIIHICSDNDSMLVINNIKQQYKKIDHFIDSYVFDAYDIDIGKSLSRSGIISDIDIRYLNTNIDAFTTEYYNWLFGINSGRILLTKEYKPKFKHFSETKEHNRKNTKFKTALELYYKNNKSNVIAPYV